MKFRAKITDPNSIRQFAQMLNIVSKWAKQFAFRVTEDKVYLLVAEKDSMDNRATASCEIPKEAIFDEFAMEGITQEDNEIFLEVESANIMTCVNSLKGSSEFVKIKLTKKVVPCLTFEVESQSRNSNISCVHDCPAIMITRKNWGDYAEPNIPRFDISLGIPEITGLRNSMDRLKVLGQRLSMFATKNGNLSLSVENNAINCCVQFSDLRVYDLEKDTESESSPSDTGDSNEVSVEVDIKHIQLVIPNEQQKPSSFIISLLDSRMVHLLFIYGDISLQYCLPGLMT